MAIHLLLDLMRQTQRASPIFSTYDRKGSIPHATQECFKLLPQRLLLRGLEAPVGKHRRSTFFFYCDHDGVLARVVHRNVFLRLEPAQLA
ncbi:MAG: hypothetical protein HY316_03520, partial [Acidobacteria bacterium]|nr:hypothetical protein [Acidobacteriota bacterium]